jgi:hypothetical protein
MKYGDERNERTVYTAPVRNCCGKYDDDVRETITDDE